MDVLRLDSASYLPNSLVEGYKSMIWTERQAGNGEFEMNTPKIDYTRSLIPEGSLISLLDSKEVMFVETHEIAVDNKGVPYLKTKGRTFETDLENRVDTPTTPGQQWQTLKTYKTSEIVSFLVWNFLVNTTGQDPSRTGRAKSALDAVPNVVVTDSTTIVEAAKLWYLEQGDVYKEVVDFLALANLGIRNIRPSGTTGNVMSFDASATGTRGTTSKVQTANLTALRVDVYNGVDRTRQQAVVEPVIFHYESGHIDSPSYVWSIKDYKTSAMVVSSFGNNEVWPNNVAPPVIPSGLARRVLYVDGGTLADINAVVQKGTVELKKHNRAILFDGAISAVSPYKYGQHYGLGDKVTVMAQYGFEASMTVAEFIRTEDESGDRGYPTLILAE